MSEKKKKQGQNIGVNALVFVLFWLISLGFLEFSSWDIYSNIYNFVAVNLPEFLQRLWIAFLLHGFIIGLGLGLAQKVAIQALSPIRLKYWLRLHLFVFIAAKMAEYSIMRFWDWRSYDDMGILYFSVSLLSQVLLTMGGWWILRKHYQQAFVWCLTLIPVLSQTLLGYTPAFLPYPIIFQTLISALALLWMNRQSIQPEKVKNSAEAEARLLDNLHDMEEDQAFLAQVQASEA